MTIVALVRYREWSWKQPPKAAPWRSCRARRNLRVWEQTAVQIVSGGLAILPSTAESPRRNLISFALIVRGIAPCAIGTRRFYQIPSVHRPRPGRCKGRKSLMMKGAAKARAGSPARSDLRMGPWASAVPAPTTAENEFSRRATIQSTQSTAVDCCTGTSHSSER